MKPINALEEHKTVHLPIDQLYPFVRHPYQVRDDAEMEELAQSVRENGILSFLLPLAPVPPGVRRMHLLFAPR